MFSSRRSQKLRENNLNQNLVWPANPDYQNPIVAVLIDEERHPNFNFKLMNGEKASINDFGKKMTCRAIIHDGIK